MTKVTISPNDDEPSLERIGRRTTRTTLAKLNTAQLLALGAIAGPILFTLAWFVLGFVSPGFIIFGTLVAPYSPISQPISGLGLGLTALFMNATFIAGGLLIIAGAVGIFQSIPDMGPRARWSGTLLLARLAGAGGAR